MSHETLVVAIVDDYASVCTGVQRFLRSAGWCATAFTSGVEFLASLPKGAPDFVVLDIVMPVMTGPEVLAEMRARGVDLPVVFISAEESLNLDAVGQECARVAFLSKPFDGDRLIALIQAGLDSSAH